MCRDPQKPSNKFATIAGKTNSSGNHDFDDYKYLSVAIRQVCQYNSTFSAITFEDFDSMLTSSLNRSIEKTPENISPVEQIIKF